MLALSGRDTSDTRATHRLDIIGTEQLLWALGGFAEAKGERTEPRAYRSKGEVLEPWQIRQILALAERGKREHAGRVKEFVEREGLSYNSVTTMIYHVRSGRPPRSWKHILEAQ